MTKCTWLTKPQNFERVPSNLLNRLIPKRSKLGWFVNEQHIHVILDFPIQNHIFKETSNLLMTHVHPCAPMCAHVWTMNEL